MGSELARPDDQGSKVTIVEQRSQALMQLHRFIRFKKNPMVLVMTPYRHYIPLRKDDFEERAYDLHGGLTRSQISDVHNYVIRQAENMDEYGHYIRFGITVDDAMLSPELNGFNIEFTDKHRPLVWDTRNICWLPGEDINMPVWRSPYPRLQEQCKDDAPRIPFILSLAGGNEDLYDDIMQSIAPMIMEKKPDGVIWWVGNGANGKSTLMDALYRLFPGQLCSLNTKGLEDGRDTLQLNTALANVVKESSEGRVEDTERYKCLGTHENFWVHKFHSQDGAEVNGNIHTIFNANNIPAFSDKGHSAKRRTFIIPFRETFQSDPDFESKTFTPEFFARLVAEMTKYAQRLKKQGYRYKWSAVTAGAKDQYDREASNAEEYAAQMVRDGLVAFMGYNQLRIDYENWCADEGYPALGITHLRKAMTNAGFERVSRSDEGGVSKFYRLNTVGSDVHLLQMSLGRPGLFTTDGFTNEGVPAEEKPEQTSILNKKW